VFSIFLLDSQILSVLVNYKLQQNSPLKLSGQLGSSQSEGLLLRELVHCCASSEKKPSTLLSNISRPYRLKTREPLVYIGVMSYFSALLGVCIDAVGNVLNTTGSEQQYEIFHKIR